MEDDLESHGRNNGGREEGLPPGFLEQEEFEFGSEGQDGVRKGVPSSSARWWGKQ